MLKADFFVHEKALVEEGAHVGKGSRVWAFAHIMKDAIIGEYCNIGNYAFVESGANLGNHVTVKNGVQIWEGIIAEEGVFFGPNCVLTNDLMPRNLISRHKTDWLLPTKFEKGCSIGANATIICGLTVGAFAMIGAGSVVTKNVPAHALVYGNPAKLKGWVCFCGKKLETHSMYCTACDKQYVLINEKLSISGD